MSSEVSSSILKKLEKLKAMTKSSNLEESKVALQKLRELLDKYDLEENSILDLEQKKYDVNKEVFRKKSKKIYYDRFDLGNYERRLKTYEINLASSIGLLFDCETTFEEYMINFYGTNIDPKIALEMYTWVRSNLIKEARKKSRGDAKINPNHKRNYVHNFLIGAEISISERCLIMWVNRKKKYEEQNKKLTLS